MTLWEHLQYFNKYGRWSPISRSMRRRVAAVDMRQLDSLTVFCTRCERVQEKPHPPCFSAERCDCMCTQKALRKARSDI